MTDYVGYFLNATPDVVALETLEIAHPAFSKTYYAVRNAGDGLTATLETGEEVTFDYVPMEIRRQAVKDDLDQSIGIDFADLGEILPKEFDRVRKAGGFTTEVDVIYRAYRSDDLSGPMDGPIDYKVRTFTHNREGASFEAGARPLNVNKTGELYTLERFPLRGFL